MQIKSTISYHYTTSRISKIKKKKNCDNTNAGKDEEKLDHLHITGGNVKWNVLSRKERVSLKTKHAISLQSSYCTPGYLSQRN